MEVGNFPSEKMNPPTPYADACALENLKDDVVATLLVYLTARSVSALSSCSKSLLAAASLQASTWRRPSRRLSSSPHESPGPGLSIITSARAAMHAVVRRGGGPGALGAPGRVPDFNGTYL